MRHSAKLKDRIEKHRWALLAAVVALGLALRVAHVLSQRGDVLFELPPLDEERYVRDARALARGGAGPRGPYWQPPGILYVLAATFRLFGDGLLAARLVQVLVSSACIVLVFVLARRFFSTSIALVGSALVAQHGVLVHAASELLPATWIGFFALLALVLLVREDRPSRFFAGVAVGVAAVFGPTSLLIVPLAIAWLLRRAIDRGPAIALFVVGVALPIAPVTARNHAESGELVLVSTNGGLNFFLGNNDDPAHTLGARPGPRWAALLERPEADGVTKPGARSTWFHRQALRFMREQPLAAARNFARKTWLFFHGAEIPRDTDLRVARRESPVLRALVFGTLPNGIVLPLALFGAFACLRRSERPFLLPGFLLVQLVAVALFFVSSRHRVPALPIACLLAVVGGSFVLERRMRLVPLALALVAFNLPVRETSRSLAGEREFQRGLVHQRRMAFEPAIDAFRRAAALDPEDPRPMFELGNVLSSRGRTAEAIDAWEEAARRDPWDPEPRRAIARVADRPRAIAALEANVASAARSPSHYFHEHATLAVLHAHEGHRDESLAALRRASQADRAAFARASRALVARMPKTDRALLDALARLLDELGQPDAAADARAL